MSRFEAFSNEELWALQNGLLFGSDYASNRKSLAWLMYEDISKVRDEREHARITALPHCSYCNQVIVGNRQ